MIDDTRLSVTPQPYEAPHNIRLLSFPNGLIIVAWVTKTEDGVIKCVFPMELVIGVHEDESIAEYEFTPYLENLAEFDINKPYEHTFPVIALQSVNIPSEHVCRNYRGHLLLLKHISNEMRGFDNLERLH